ncbi:hypothetical protein CORC01_02180 [Colletotrichum orchidophilum]|uniref:Uncharacterized protein n=1 Tax=Colletotrichum orchidophilum TaxID=1209926 RepID=A0A1G4BMD1_9PEZI|nr:uncharacterized protein CORC01_02180 [Colletotrichum orchidophilum]OHF02485.1 hypothetical protein CORC01_02180 [Colletotrichum orchidophilum]
MAESVGLAASVAGLVSLGLQITGGIVKYLDAFEGRHDELTSVKEQNDNLTVTLRAMQTTLSGLQHQNPEVTTAVAQNIQSCEKELSAVEALCENLSDGDGKTWPKRLMNNKKKLTYAFHQSKLQHLAQRLQQAHGILQLAMANLGLESSKLNTNKLAAIESVSRDQASDLLLIRSDVIALATPVANINDRLPSLQSSVEQTAQLFVAHSGAMTASIHESSQVVRQDILQSHDSIEERLERIESELQLQREQNQSLQTIALRVASKPAILRSLCDDMQSPVKDRNQGIASNLPIVHSKRMSSDPLQNSWPAAISDMLCICPRPARSTIKKQMQRGHTILSGEWESQGHWPSCPLSKTGRKQRLKASLTYTGLARLLKSVIGISLELTSGAGGRSISPRFTYYPTVDADSDPAFRIIRMVEQCCVRPFHDGTNREPFIIACLKKLARLLEEKRTYPTVVDQQNRTLMHHAAISIREIYYDWGDSSPEVTMFAAIFPMLLSYGIPAYSYDIEGTSALHHLTFQVEDWTWEAVDALTRANFESQPSVLNGSSTDIINIPVGMDTSILSYDKFPEAATAFECGPLSLAVANSDVHGVVRVLSRFPDSIAEVDIYGRSPLHLAAVKPEILDILVKAADLSILNQRDKAGATALETAMALSSRHCVNGRGDKPEGVTRLTYVEAIRFMTFEALGLDHRCCKPYPLVEEGVEWIDMDDTEIIEEQDFLVQLHEELVVEFTEEAGAYLGDGPDNLPLFPQFWKSYWTERITEELEVLDGEELTDAERRGAEEIGVVWRGPTESVARSLYHVCELEYFFCELDLICPEYKEPWPEGMRPVH